jgi:hypothetical protein
MRAATNAMVTMVTTMPDSPNGGRRSSIVVGSIWMVFLSLALFFLPLVNGLIAGAVGGYKVGGVGRALAAAILPAFVAGAGLWIAFAVFDAPIWGFLAGSAVGLIILLADVGLFIGAVAGGLLRGRT